MKTISLVMAGIVMWLSGVRVEAQSDPAAELEELVAGKRAAALSLWFSHNDPAATDLALTAVGFFISEDGLALVALTAIGWGEVPEVRTADGTVIEWGAILGLYPEQDLALMRFEHRPASWLTLASTEPEVGETVALVPLNHEDLESAAIPPIIGPIMSRRSGLQMDQRVPRFTRVLSLGVGVTPEQSGRLMPGCFAINRDGELVAGFRAVLPMATQTLIEMSPLTGFRQEFDRLSGEDAILPFPVPDEDNPVDPAMADADWEYLILAIQKRDKVTGRQVFERLNERYPESWAVRLQAIRAKFLEPAESLAMLEDYPQLDAGNSAAEQAVQLITRANLLFAAGDSEGGTRDMEAAVAVGPKDFSGHRYQLARVYEAANRPDDVERLLREAYEWWPECIELVNALERSAIRRSDLRGALALAKRANELHAIYKAP